MSFSIDPAHPSLPGHFPGQPVVPGVVLLDHVILAAREAFGHAAPLTLPRAKFAAPVLPGHIVDVALTRLAGDRVTFACAVDGQAVCSGELRFTP